LALLGTLSGGRNFRDLGAFAKRPQEALKQDIGLNLKRCPSDATFLYMLNKAPLQEFGDVLQV
jgi:hypothetical protein